jgi:hypothetical protein
VNTAFEVVCVDPHGAERRVEEKGGERNGKKKQALEMEMNKMLKENNEKERNQE